jgi:hypothetical protein
MPWCVVGFEVLLNKGHGKPVDWWTLGPEGGRWPLPSGREAGGCGTRRGRVIVAVLFSVAAG